MTRLSINGKDSFCTLQKKLESLGLRFSSPPFLRCPCYHYQAEKCLGRCLWNFEIYKVANLPEKYEHHQLKLEIILTSLIFQLQFSVFIRFIKIFTMVRYTVLPLAILAALSSFAAANNCKVNLNYCGATLLRVGV